MKFSLKTLGIGFGILAVVWVVLHQVDRSIKESGEGVTENTRLGPRAIQGLEENAAKQQRLKRARKLSSAEAAQLLKEIIIPRAEFEDTSLVDALDFLNAEIAKQIPEDQPRPMVKVDQVYLNAQKESYAAYQDVLGYTTFDHAEIGELRVINTPAEALLRYICDATHTRYWLYEGNAYLSPYPGPYSEERFLYEEVFNKVDLMDVALDQVQGTMNEVVSRHEYYGHKRDVQFMMSEKARQALLSGQVNFPKLNLKMENTTMIDVLGAICKQPNLHYHIVGVGEIIFDPLGEYADYASRVNPFDAEPASDSPFVVPLDENWKTWKPPVIEPFPVTPASPTSFETRPLREGEKRR